jgi:hypothetical protein
MQPEYSLAYVIVNDDIRVDTAVACGNRLEGVAWILDFKSSNPSLRVEKGVGLELAKKVIARAEQGGFTE